MRPLVGRTKPASMLKNVLLPVPLGPMTERISLGVSDSEKETASSVRLPAPLPRLGP